MRRGTRLPGGASHGTDLGLRIVTKQKYFKRRVRERMQKTGESYTTARLHLLGAVPDAPREIPPARGEAARVRLRRRRSLRRAGGPPGLRYVAPAFGIVISLVIGVAGFLTLTTAHPSGPSSPYVVEGRP